MVLWRWAALIWLLPLLSCGCARQKDAGQAAAQWALDVAKEEGKVKVLHTSFSSAGEEKRLNLFVASTEAAAPDWSSAKLPYLLKLAYKIEQERKLGITKVTFVLADPSTMDPLSISSTPMEQVKAFAEGKLPLEKMMWVQEGRGF